MGLSALFTYLEECLAMYDDMIIEDMFDVGKQAAYQEIYDLINEVP